MWNIIWALLCLLISYSSNVIAHNFHYLHFAIRWYRIICAVIKSIINIYLIYHNNISNITVIYTRAYRFSKSKLISEYLTENNSSSFNLTNAKNLKLTCKKYVAAIAIKNIYYFDIIIINNQLIIKVILNNIKY